MSDIYTTIADCRLCGCADLAEVVHLGERPLSGTFPLPDESVPSGPLRLLRCQACGLVQLGENYRPDLLYGENYGYRSGLNRAMVEHLQDLARYAARVADLQPGDLVVDVGSNDGTLLRSYPTKGLSKVGIDPTAAKFREHYEPEVEVYPGFFSGEAIEALGIACKARIVTSIACFYDLERPLAFVNDVLEALADDGIWISEQSYLPAMIQAHAYDTICHEHLEYYRLADFAFIARLYGLQILDVAMNDVNGGSFRVTLAREGAPYVGNPAKVNETLAAEDRDYGWLCVPRPMRDLAGWLPGHRDALLSTLANFKARGKTVMGYGASTKGNVLLNYCGIGPDLLPAIAEVNEDKFGRVTPGSAIPIIPEAEARERADAFLVLPWHFRREICRKEEGFLLSGGQLIFPLPEVEVIG